MLLINSTVNCVSFHPEGQCLASGSADRTLKMWDIRSHLLIQHYPAHDDEITSISMHPVRSSNNSLLLLWVGDVHDINLIGCIFP